MSIVDGAWVFADASALDWPDSEGFMFDRASLFIFLNGFTFGGMELIDGAFLIVYGRTVLDALLGVTVVIRDDKMVK